METVATSNSNYLEKILSVEEVLEDSPFVRTKLSQLETENDSFSNWLVSLRKYSTHMNEAAIQYGKASTEFANELLKWNYKGNDLYDASIYRFATTLKEIDVARQTLHSQIGDLLFKPITNMLETISQTKILSKNVTDTGKHYDAMLLKLSSMKKRDPGNKEEIEAENMKKDYQEKQIELAFKTLEINQNYKTKSIEMIIMVIYAWIAFFKQGNEIITTELYECCIPLTQEIDQNKKVFDTAMSQYHSKFNLFRDFKASTDKTSSSSSASSSSGGPPPSLSSQINTSMTKKRATEKSGYLFKKMDSSLRSDTWKRRFFRITNGMLYYYKIQTSSLISDFIHSSTSSSSSSNFSNNNNDPITSSTTSSSTSSNEETDIDTKLKEQTPTAAHSLILFTAREITSKTERKYCFEFVSPNITYVLQATSEDEMHQWIDVVRNAAADLLYSTSDIPNPHTTSSTYTNNQQQQQQQQQQKQNNDNNNNENNETTTTKEEKEEQENETTRRKKIRTRKQISSSSSPATSSTQLLPLSTTSSLTSSLSTTTTTKTTTTNKLNTNTNTNTNTTNTTNNINKTPLEILREKDPQNAYCVDCNSPNPEWAVINKGFLICIQCSGHHRSLGTHISKVRSLLLDSCFTPPSPLLPLLLSLGNTSSSLLYGPPSPTPSLSHITSKYLSLLYIPPLPPSPPLKLLWQHAVLHGSLLDIRDVFERGRDGRVMEEVVQEEEGEEVVHVMARRGWREGLEWVVGNGGSVGRVGRWGRKRSVLMCAVEGGDVKSVVWVVRKGVDVSYLDAEGKSAVAIAVEYERVECVVLLRLAELAKEEKMRNSNHSSSHSSSSSHSHGSSTSHGSGDHYKGGEMGEEEESFSAALEGLESQALSSSSSSSNSSS